MTPILFNLMYLKKINNMKLGRGRNIANLSYKNISLNMIVVKIKKKKTRFLNSCVSRC